MKLEIEWRFPPANKGREGEVMGREGGNSGVDSCPLLRNEGGRAGLYSIIETCSYVIERSRDEHSLGNCSSHSFLNTISIF